MEKKTLYLKWMLVAMASFVLAGPAFCGDASCSLCAGLTPEILWWFAPMGALLALIFAFVFYQMMMRSPAGDPDMIEIAGYVKEGAYAYLRRQFKVVGIVFLILVGIFAIFSYILKWMNPFQPIAFLTGGAFSALAGYIGMKTATSASSRTVAGARDSLDKGLKVAFRSGAVMGLTVVGLGLLYIVMWWVILKWIYETGFLGFNAGSPELMYREITAIMLSSAMGASTQALFARVGGGIYTKAADVGADLVGKVEAGIPEDDPRNPATIADNVGDNVGDVAGMGADLFESYCGSILATAVLGAAVFSVLGFAGVVTPFVIAGVGCVLSIIGIFLVRTKEGATQKQLLSSLGRGVNVSSILIIAAVMVLIWILLPDHKGIMFSVISGLVAGILIGKVTEYYTADEFKPTQSIAQQAETGPATVIINGLAVGMSSAALPVLIIGVTILAAFGFAGGFTNVSLGLFGVGVAAVGLLSTLGITLATDAYGPIADNAGGNAEMTGQEPFVRERTDSLDSLGNTTAAVGKGFAIGSAALTALALFAAYVEAVRLWLVKAAQVSVDALPPDVQALLAEEGVTGSAAEFLRGAPLSFFLEAYDITLMNPKVLVGLFLGAASAFVFCAMAMKAVGRAAGQMVDEVRRQFREIKGILEGETKPDYARCVDISVAAAQREMILPSLTAIFVPIIAGLVLDVPGVMGLLAGALSSGFVLAIFMANSGGAWDNAKKFIEKGNMGGKGSDAHKAAVVGDTVGDPFKDTAGPSLNILIKLMSMVSVVFAGVIVKGAPFVSQLLHLD